MTPKAILFDLDGTLWDRDAAVRALWASQHQTWQDSLGHVSCDQFVESATRLDEKGTVDKRLMYQRLAQTCEFSEIVSAELYADFQSRYETLYAPFPEVIETLRELRRRGLKLGIITNGSRQIQQMKMDRMDLPPLMDVVLIGDEAGPRKPDAAIFRQAVALLGVTASEAWFVGDGPLVDIGGAYAAGLKAIWRQSEGW